MTGSSLSGHAIAVSGLHKRFGATIAIDDLTFEVQEGAFFGLLGRNGSGKTTTLHVLSTLTRPTSGHAAVTGIDVVRDPVSIRNRIGLVFQESALDRTLSVAENLAFCGALYNLPTAVSRERTSELLELFELTAVKNEPVRRLSGGMRRALDIARGVLHRPRILLLDEPTTGLDVINRRSIWRFLQRLRQEHRTTLVLTTHYLEEATDCDHVIFMAKGKVVGRGEPKPLTDELGHYMLEFETDDPQILRSHLVTRLGEPLIEGNRVTFRITDPDYALADVQAELSGVTRFQLRRPDLNDVYLWLNLADHGDR